MTVTFSHLGPATYGLEAYGFPGARPAKGDCLWGLLVRTRSGVRVIYAAEEGIRDSLAARTLGVLAFLHRDAAASPWVRTTSTGRVIA
ncbi:hypothetical protein ACH4PU_32745 [Streptomyces sp. NPDC021100]|uniref:hypothetical protein n=1 Tax=Streptomyces sp. NPDC021100 TaxID=3365114 RepID=UPI0037A8B2E8